MRFFITFRLCLTSALLLLAAGSANSQTWPGLPAPHVPSVAFAWFGGTSGSYLGIGAVEIGSKRAKSLKLQEDRGVELTCIEDNSPAAKAGLQVGDIVLQYGGEKIKGMEQLSQLVRETPAGRRVKLVIDRDGAKMTISAVVGSRAVTVPSGFRALNTSFPNDDMAAVPFVPGMPGLEQPIGGRNGERIGIEIEALPPQLAGFFGVKAGALVGSVLAQSPGEHAGIRAGDIIVKINGMQIRTPAEVVDAIDSRSSDRIPVLVVRKRRTRILRLNLDSGRPKQPSGVVAEPVNSR